MHSWTSISDVAATLATVARDERAYGKAWLVPTQAPLTVKQLSDAFVSANGAPPAKVTPLPYSVLWFAGLFDPLTKELRTTHYQFAKPFVIDSSETESTFGLKPRSMDESLREAAQSIRAEAPKPR
jgi:nucleoside-diphosphate-sugar epimerase